MGYTMATAICNSCGDRKSLSQRHRNYEPGTTVNLWCDCTETEDYWGVKHTIAAKNDKPPKRPTARAKCNVCGHERIVSQQQKTYKLGDKIKVTCHNRDSEHLWRHMYHTVIANGSGKRSADLGVKLAEHMTDRQTADLGAKLFTCMLSHHLQNMMDEAGIKKTDILGRSDSTQCLPTLSLYHGGHWLYESKKGSISLALLHGRLANPKFPYEICSWEELFEDLERFETQEKAERRIIEVLG